MKSQPLIFVLLCTLLTNSALAQARYLSPTVNTGAITVTPTFIPAGTHSQLIVVTTNPVLAAQDKLVSIPVAGQIGTITLPQGSILAGRFHQVAETTGTFTFETLVLNKRVYHISASSDNIPASQRQGTEFLMAGIGERRAYQQGINMGEYSRAGGSLLGIVSPGLSLTGAAIGAVGSIIGTSQRSDAVDQGTNRQENVLKNPNALIAELANLQTLSVYFLQNVDLTQPLATLP